MLLCEEHLDIKQPVICIVGPTASGKTDVAQCFAARHNGEVLSADSMQIYRGMDIGTGKISPDEQLVKHWGLDLVDPGTPYSAALYQKYGRNCLLDIDKRNKTALIAGGTGLYVRSVIDDYDFPSGEQDPRLNEVRARYTHYAQTYGDQALWDKLNELDPQSAHLIHPHNVKRVIRAFEMWELEGKRYVDQHAGFQTMKQYVPAYLFELDVTPELLANRINRRVDAMINKGLLEEVRALKKAGFTNALTSREAIGYKEFVSLVQPDTLDNALLLQAVEDVKTASRRYAKRQRSWWRNDDRVVRIAADDGDVERICDDIEQVLIDKGWPHEFC